MARKRSLAAQRLVLGPDADGQYDGVHDTEEQCPGDEAEGQRQNRDFERDDQIIGMVDEAVGSTADERRPGNDDDRASARPVGNHPQSRHLSNRTVRKASDGCRERDTQSARGDVDGTISDRAAPNRRAVIKRRRMRLKQSSAIALVTNDRMTSAARSRRFEEDQRGEDGAKAVTAPSGKPR